MVAKRHLNGTSQEGTYICTYTHTDIATMTESAQWADSVKIYNNFFQLAYDHFSHPKYYNGV